MDHEKWQKDAEILIFVYDRWKENKLARGKGNPLMEEREKE